MTTKANTPPALTRRFRGTVVSSAMNKTAVVKVERYTLHPKYQRRYLVSKRYKVHDEKNECVAGDVVEFIEVRPISKEKRWRIIRKVAP